MYFPDVYCAILLRWYTGCSPSGRFCHFSLTSEYLDLTHCDYPLLLKRNRTFPSTVFSTYTMAEMLQLDPRRSATLLPFIPERNTARSRMDLRVTPSDCLGSTSAQHRLFYVLTTLFPSISRYKRSYTRADKQDGNSNDDPILSPTHFQSVEWPIPRVLSALIMMVLTRIYAPSLLLCLFILVHCLDPHQMITWPTLTNPFWTAVTLSMINLQPHIRRRDTNTRHRHPRRPYCRQ